jgi:hypothetical protein
MPRLSSFDNAVSRLSPIAGEVVKRFGDKPGLRATAAALAAQALARLEPPVTLAPEDVALGWPGEVTATGTTEHLALPDLLIDLFASEGILTVVPGYQVALQRQEQAWVPLELDLGQLAQELDAVRPWLELAYFEALVQFWSNTDAHGKTHWAWMADYLRRAFSQALEAANLAGRLPPEAYLAGLSLTPRSNPLAPPQASSGPEVIASLVQLEHRGKAVPFDAKLDPHLLLTLSPGQGHDERFLAFSPSAGLRYFASAAALLADFSQRPDNATTFETAQLRRLTVEGDIFTALARTLLQTQLIQLGRVVKVVRDAADGLGGETLQASSQALSGFFLLDAQVQAQAHRWLQLQLPQWLRRAPAKDRWRFASELAQAALGEPLSSHNWFLDGIPNLPTYALARLREEAARLHPQGPVLEPSNIEATRVYVEQDLISVTGGPFTPVLREAPVEVTELAINNLSSYNHGWLKVKPKPGKTLPAWLDGDALKALIRAIDVGGTYPRLLREHLLEGPEATGRQALFSRQVAIQLPLLAWELVLRGKSGMGRAGYALVREGIGAHPAEQGTRLMALGVTAGEAYGIDRIAATYVFVRQDKLAEPCVLYRPLHTDPLRQYGSLDALWEDLAAPGTLQDEALRWMTDLGRSRYSHGGWREPRVVRFGPGDEFAPLQRPGPARPALEPLASPLLATLYRQVVGAMIEMAERRSVSNAEDDWVSLGTLASILFNGVLPVFNGPLAGAAWLIQLSDQFARYLEAADAPGAASVDARNDLLFSVVLLLVSEGVHWPIDEPLERFLEGRSKGAGEPGLDETPSSLAKPGAGGPAAISPGPRPMTLTLAQGAVKESQALARPHDLDLSWTSAEPVLGLHARQALAAMRARLPLQVDSPIPHGPTQGLYLYQNHLWVRWQDHFYAVNLEGEAPRIVGPQGELGPRLRRDEAGRWTLDLRLRLRGGGPKRRIEARRRQNEQDRAQAEQIFKEAVPAFDALRNAANPLAEEVDQAALRNEPQPAKREALDALLREGYERCRELTARYEALHQSTPLPHFAERQCLLLARLLNVSKAMIENLLEHSREFLEASPLFGLSPEVFESAAAADPSLWPQFLGEFERLTERTIGYLQHHHDTVERLSVFPGIGARVLLENSTSVALTTSLPELWSSLAYCQLCQALEPLRRAPSVAAQVHAALDPVLVHSTSHADAVDDASLSAEEKIRVFDTAVLNYQKAEDAVRAFTQTLAVEHRSVALERFEASTMALRADAERRMGALIRSQSVEQPGPSLQLPRPLARTRPRQGTKVVAGSARKPDTASGSSQAPADGPELIHTVDGEAVMAHVRPLPGKQGKVAEVIANGRVLASWRKEGAASGWHRLAAAPAAATPGATVRLNTLIREAEQALAAAQRELQQANRLKQATRIPADIEDLYHQRAERLDGLAERIEQALTRMNATDAATEEHGSAQVKALRLRDQASQARRVGTAARIELSKSLMPTAGRVDFLLQAGEVSIRRLARRTPLKREGRRDFVQEYEIVDRQNHPLWYAHFHYDTAAAAPERYTAAHLKTVTQRFDGYQRQLQQATNDQEVVSIYRSRIDPALARKLFLSLP